MDLSREKIISLATSTASASVEGVIPTRELPEHDSRIYFYQKFDRALDKFCAIMNIESININLSESEIMDLAETAARVCTRGYISIGEIKEYESEDYFLHAFKDGLSTFKEREETKKQVADKIRATSSKEEETLRGLFR